MVVEPKSIRVLSAERRKLLHLLLPGVRSASQHEVITKRAAAEPVPLSFAQQRMWFLDQLEPKSPLYCLPGVLRLKGTLDLVALQRSLSEIVRRHEVLRTTFSIVDP